MLGDDTLNTPDASLSSDGADSHFLTCLNWAGRGYTVVASWLLSTLILFALLNLAIHYLVMPRLTRIITALPITQQTHVSTLGIGNLRRVYPGMSDSDIETLIGETWGRGQVYEPWAEFRELPWTGTYYHQTEHGYRSNAEVPPWPPRRDALNVFVFGGSTLYGYSVPDAHTIPAYLQGLLADRLGTRNVAVYNFGNGFYYSVQERVRFENLLLKGFVPDVAIFVDGLNDFMQATPDGDDLPNFRYLVEAALRGEYHVNVNVFDRLPLIQALRQVRTHWEYQYAKRRPHSSQQRRLSAKEIVQLREKWRRETPPAFLRLVLDRYRRNQELLTHLCGAYGVKPLFVWQPVPSYKYDLREHLFAFRRNPLSGHTRGQEGYRLAREQYEQGRFGNAFLWLGDMQEHRSGPLYVDPVHYTSDMNSLIASQIATFLTTLYPGLADEERPVVGHS